MKGGEEALEGETPVCHQNNGGDKEATSHAASHRHGQCSTAQSRHSILISSLNYKRTRCVCVLKVGAGSACGARLYTHQRFSGSGTSGASTGAARAGLGASSLRGRMSSPIRRSGSPDATASCAASRSDSSDRPREAMGGWMRTCGGWVVLVGRKPAMQRAASLLPRKHANKNLHKLASHPNIAASHQVLVPAGHQVARALDRDGHDVHACPGRHHKGALRAERGAKHEALERRLETGGDVIAAKSIKKFPPPLRHLFKGVHLAILAARALREKGDGGAVAEEGVALFQAFLLRLAVVSDEPDVPCGENGGPRWIT